MSLSNVIQKLKDTQNNLHEHGQTMGSTAISAKYSSIFNLLNKTYDDAVRNNQINKNDYKELHDNTFIGNVCGGSDLKRQLVDYLGYANKLMAKQNESITSVKKRLQDKKNPDNWNDNINKKLQNALKTYMSNNKILENDIKNIKPVVKHDIYPQLEYKYQINKNPIRIIPTNVLPVTVSDVENLVSRGIRYMTDVNQKVQKRFANIPKVGGNQKKNPTNARHVIYTNQPLISKSRQQNANISARNPNAQIRSNINNNNAPQQSGKKGGIFHKVVNYFSKPYRSNKAANAQTNMNYGASMAHAPQQAYLARSRQRSITNANASQYKKQSDEAMAEAINRVNNPSSMQQSLYSQHSENQNRLRIAHSNSVSVSNSLSASASISNSNAQSYSNSVSISQSVSHKAMLSNKAKNSNSIDNNKKAKSANMGDKNNQKAIAKRIKQHADEIRNITNSNEKSSNSNKSIASSSNSSSQVNTSTATSTMSSNSHVTGSALQKRIINNVNQLGSLSDFNSFSATDAIAKRDVKINALQSASSSASTANSNAVATLKIINKHKLSAMSTNNSVAMQKSLNSQSTSCSNSAFTVQNSLKDSATQALSSTSTSASNSATANIAKILTNAHAMAVKSGQNVKTRMSFVNKQNKKSMAKSYTASANVVINNNRANDNIDKHKSLASQSSAFKKSISAKQDAYNSLATTNNKLSSAVASYQNQMDSINSLIGK